MTLDHVNPGLVDNVSQLVSGFIDAGTEVRSFIFHADSIGTNSVVLSGYAIFNVDILGVLMETATLNASDSILGRPGIQYTPTNSGRRLELAPGGNPPYTFAISSDRRRIDFTLNVGPPYDQLRVVTAVPEPSSIGWLSLMLGISAMRRTRN